MTLEAVLASLHLLAILTLVVFLSSEAALCRREWMNAAVVERLVRLDAICLGALLAVLLTGVARIVWGVKGGNWYVSQPLFHLKATLFLLMMVLWCWPAAAFRRWRRAHRADGTLPNEDDVRRVRRIVMLSSHVLPVAGVIAVFWARGW